MAIKHIIAGGIGFAPGSVEYIVTRGFDSSSAVAAAIASLRIDRVSVAPRMILNETTAIPRMQVAEVTAND